MELKRDKRPCLLKNIDINGNMYIYRIIMLKNSKSGDFDTLAPLKIAKWGFSGCDWQFG
jgi:hypothetical protein